MTRLHVRHTTVALLAGLLLLGWADGAAAQTANQPTMRLQPDAKSQTLLQAAAGATTVRQRDSLWNGFLIGAAAGTAPAIYWAIADPNECNVICMDDLAIGVGMGAAIGVAIDAAIRKKVTAPRGPTSRAPGGKALAIAPVVSPRRVGVGLTMSF
jgi:hypothetical protein